MSFDDEAVIFDHGIAKDFVAGVVNLFAPDVGIRAGQFDFEVFADVDGAEAFVAHLFKGILDRLALRIQDGRFRSDDNFRFHFKNAAPGRHGPMLEKPAACASLFFKHHAAILILTAAAEPLLLPAEYMDNLQDELKELKGFIAELKADRVATKEKEKREAWTKYVSLTVVIIAVLGSIATQWAGKYSSRVQLSQARASDSWNLYQARSVKGHLLEVTTNFLSKMNEASNNPEVQQMLADYSKAVAKYDAGKDESQRIAKAYEEDRDDAQALGKKLAPAIPLFSVSIAMASMCLLTKRKPLWLVAMIAAAIATVMMASARLAEAPLKGPQAEKASLPTKAPAAQVKHGEGNKAGSDDPAKK
jgi:hypothetical protein